MPPLSRISPPALFQRRPSVNARPPGIFAVASPQASLIHRPFPLTHSLESRSSHERHICRRRRRAPGQRAARRRHERGDTDEVFQRYIHIYIYILSRREEAMDIRKNRAINANTPKTAKSEKEPTPSSTSATSAPPASPSPLRRSRSPPRSSDCRWTRSARPNSCRSCATRTSSASSTCSRARART